MRRAVAHPRAQVFDDLHLNVSIRSLRAEKVSAFVKARVLDASLPERERYRAMSDVLSMKMALSDEMVRNVLARMIRSPDVDERGHLLAMLAGQRRPEIVQPLIDMARYDTDSSLRIEAVKLLAADFPKEPSARATLELIAADTSNPKVQTAAGKALGGLPGN